MQTDGDIRLKYCSRMECEMGLLGLKTDTDYIDLAFYYLIFYCANLWIHLQSSDTGQLCVRKLFKIKSLILSYIHTCDWLIFHFKDEYL